MIGAPARLRDYFDPAEAYSVVLSSERILVNANLLYGLLSRQCPPRETVDVELTAIWPSCRPSHGAQSICKVIRIVGQRVEVFSLQHDRPCVAVRVPAQACVGRIDGRLLLGDRHS